LAATAVEQAEGLLDGLTMALGKIGIDAGRGIMLTGGSVSLYRRVLEAFVRDAARRVAFFGQEPDAANRSPAAISAHAVKSAAQSIGAAELGDLARHLEAALNAGDAVSEQWTGFAAELKRVRDGIAAALDDGNASAGQTVRQSAFITSVSLETAEGRKIEAMLDELEAALGERRIGTVDRLFDELERLGLDGDMRKTLAEANDMVLMGEFEDAARTVGGLRDGRTERQ
jgi:HPt (histidine-containing phosphotransfer) domain-containing protein